MAGFDYWHLPALEASLPPTDDEEPSEAAHGDVDHHAPEGDANGDGGGGCATKPSEEVLLLSAAAAPPPMRLPQLVLASGESRGDHSGRGLTVAADPAVDDLEMVIGLDEEHIKQSSYPVRLMSLPSYIRLLRPAGDTPGDTTDNTLAASSRVCVAAKLADEGGTDILPRELFLQTGEPCSPWKNPREPPVASAQLSQRSAAVVPNLGRAGPSGPCTGSLWRSFYGGSLVGPDPLLCDGIGPVPELPNPFVILNDAPAVINEMLAAVPEEARDAKAFQAPIPVEGLPALCRGPGGILPGFTPRQLARNLLAAALLNRLSANLLTACAVCSEALRAAGPGELPEERALASARHALREAREGEELARREEAEACAELEAFRGAGRAEPEEQRRLEGMVGWKSSVRVQLEAELAESLQALSATEEALSAARKRQREVPWRERWPDLVPQAASAEPLFSVRLTARSPELVTVKDFVDALQLGLIDRSGSGFVTKHALEAAFVSHMADSLLLCTRAGDGLHLVEAKEMYTHIPVPECAGTGVVQPGSHHDLRAPRPHHLLLLRTEGQTFPFSVVFGPFHDRTAGFVGLGAHALTFSTPWNPFNYGDVLWAREAQQSLNVLPVLAMLGALVMDPDVCLGPFPAEGPVQDREIPLGTASLAVLQAVLFSDVKMWPVALPDGLRRRWEFALRALRHLLARHREEGELGGSHATNTVLNAVLDEALPQMLEALAKVPSDGVGGGAGGCRGFADRLKRMELSALTRTPINGASRFRRVLEELCGLWQHFEDETGA